MKIINLFFIVGVIVLLLVACKPKVSQVNAPNTNGQDSIKQNTNPNAAFDPANQKTLMYDYSKIKLYDYKTKAYLPNGSVSYAYFNQTVSSDEVNGVKAWHIITWASLYEMSIDSNFKGYTELWFDKASDKCVKSQNVNEAYGNKSFSKAPCGPTTTVGNMESNLLFYLRDQKLTTEFGTFDTKVYGMKGILEYYYADNYAAPVKMIWGPNESASGTMTYILVKYA